MTKFVRRRASNTSTHIPGPGPRWLVYIPLMQGAPHILIVDDHREIRDLVSRALTKDGFRVSVAADGRAMRKVLDDSRIDLILLDLMLPGEDGLSLCRSLRAKSSIPIIMLTAKGDEVDRVIGLEMGADDYLPKPFGSRELVARIRAVLRRSQENNGADKPDQRPKHYRFDRWRLDTGRRELLRDDGVAIAAQHRRIRSPDCFRGATAARAQPRSAARPRARPCRKCARPQHRHAGEPSAPKARA